MTLQIIERTMRRLEIELSETLTEMNSYKLNNHIVCATTSHCGDLCVAQMFIVSGGSSG